MPRRRTPEEQAHADALKALVGTNFHARPLVDVWPAVGSRPGGLSPEEVAAMKETYGPNSTPTKVGRRARSCAGFRSHWRTQPESAQHLRRRWLQQKPGLLYRIGMQLHNSVIYILIVGGKASSRHEQLHAWPLATQHAGTASHCAAPTACVGACRQQL